MSMTREQRTAEFLRLFNLVPAKSNVERIRKVCDLMMYSEITVRQYLTKNAIRVPSERDLVYLGEAIAKITE